MSSDVGLTLDERIRRSLPPLACPLRIDAFLAVMIRERSRLAQARARSAREAAARKPERPPAAEREPAGEAVETTAEGGAADLADSTKLRAEVDEFLHRDDRKDASQNEVNDYMDFMGPTGFNPDELPE